MRLRHIEVFNAVMHTGSVSAAARLINISQPAVSRTLQHAELQLGFALFQRSKGRLTPTSEALALLPHMEKLFAQLEEVQRLADSLRKGRATDELRIASVLALSHDEVVHGKKPLVLKAPGDWEQQRAGLRAFYAYMWTTPGKKLLFMGQEFAHSQEWNHDVALPWEKSGWPDHAGMAELVRELNRLYVERPDWYASDMQPAGQQWLNGDDAENSVYVYRRLDEGTGRSSVVVLNMTPVYRENYHLPVPQAGQYRYVLNTDEGRFGGWSHEVGDPQAWEEPLLGQPARLSLNLPPLSALVLELDHGEQD